VLLLLLLLFVVYGVANCFDKNVNFYFLFRYRYVSVVLHKDFFCYGSYVEVGVNR
jgi:hypothetical protein